MSEKAKKPTKLRTWSSLGDVRRRPSEYEVVTHKSNYTMRDGRIAPLEQNTSSPANMWISTYREGSDFQATDWEAFRDPDTVTYRSYVALQNDEEVRIGGLLENYAKSGHDEKLNADWVATLAMVFTPTRYMVHGMQRVEAYISSMAPSGYVTNAAAFGAADFLRRNTLVAYRTRELQKAFPDHGFVTEERKIWETHAAWQPTRELIERALTAYDLGEAFTAMNLVIAPTLDDLLLRQLGETARKNGDELMWHVAASLVKDTDRRSRWSAALCKMVVEQNPSSADAVNNWIEKWALRADAAASALAPLVSGHAEASASYRNDVLTAAGLRGADKMN